MNSFVRHTAQGTWRRIQKEPPEVGVSVLCRQYPTPEEKSPLITVYWIVVTNLWNGNLFYYCGNFRRIGQLK